MSGGSSQSPEDFVPKRDWPLLRRWIERLRDEHGVALHSLIEGLQGHRSQHGRMSLSTLRRLMNGETGRWYSNTPDQLMGLWEFLSSKTEYRRYLPDRGRAKEQAVAAVMPAADELLALSLRRFLDQDGSMANARTLDALRRLPGRYVMYRLDMEPAVRGLAASEAVRASLIEVEESGGGETSCLRIRETQDFHGTPARHEHHTQTNEGVTVPYGKYMIAIFGAVGRVSFKCMVVDDTFLPRYEKPLEEFSGRLLVASEVVFSPSVKFVCRRFAGETPPHHGIYPYSQVDKDVVRYLTTPSFEGYTVVP